MARCAVIDGSIVVNVIEAEPDFVLEGLEVIASDIAGIDWSHVGDQFIPPKSPPEPVPDNPTLGDWRVALLLWGRLADMQKRVTDLKAAGNPLGAVADERMNYSNNVLLAQLMQLKDVFGFSAAEVEESLWRADQVSKGDLSGVWPLAENSGGSV